MKGLIGKRFKIIVKNFLCIILIMIMSSLNMVCQEVARKLGVSVHIIKNAGHFNEQSGYETFEELFKGIKIFYKYIY